MPQKNRGGGSSNQQRRGEAATEARGRRDDGRLGRAATGGREGVPRRAADGSRDGRTAATTGCADRKNEGRQRRTNGAGGWSHHRDGRTAASGRTAAEKVDLGCDTMIPEMERETIESKRARVAASSK